MMQMTYPKRYIFVLLMLTSFLVFTVTRDCLNITIVKISGGFKGDPNEKNGTVTGGNLRLGERKKGGLLSAFYWGALITQLPSGILSTKYGGKLFLGMGQMASCMLTFISPIAATTSYQLFVVVRFLLGLALGMSIPAAQALIGKWTPRKERTLMVGFCFSGLDLGSVLALTLGGYLSNLDALNGWPLCFYTFGSLTFLWCIAWGLWGHESPVSHPSISKDEQLQIMGEDNRVQSQNIKIPWSEIVRSIPVVSMAVLEFTTRWVLFLLLVDLPSFFSNILQLNLKENGFYSALPVIVGVLFYTLGGLFADKVLQRYISVLNIRRLYALVGSYVSSLLLCCLAFVCAGHKTMSVTCITLVYGFSSLVKLTSNSNQVDLTSRFAGVMMAISNTFANLAGGIAPILTGVITDMEASIENFRKIFLIAAGISAFGGTFFILFGSGDEQEWSKSSSGNGKGHEYKALTNSPPEDESEDDGTENENDNMTAE